MLQTDSKKWDLMGLNLTLLSLSGILPTPRIASSSWKLLLYRAYPIFMVTLYIMVLTAQCLALYQFWGDLDAVTDNTFLLVGVFMCYCEAAYAFANIEKILRLVDVLENKLTPQMKTLASSKEQANMITSTANMTRQLTLIMLVLIHVNLATWVAVPLMHKYSQGAEGAELDPGKPSPYFCFIIWLPFDATVSPIYEITYSIQVISFLVASWYYTSINTTFITLIIHTATQFKILVMSLRDMDELFPVHRVRLEEETEAVPEHVAVGRPEDAAGLSNDVELNAYFIECIKHHQAIIRFAQDLNDVLSPVLLFCFCCSQLIVCVVTFQVAVSWGQGNSVLKFVLGLAAAGCGPLMFCWLGNDIIQESLAVQQAAYNCSWYHRSTSFKFLLAVVIMRAQKPVRLYAGVFYDVSLTTFTRMLNTVYTYFAVLKQLYEE